ncbi:FmdB family transcriptional regulator [Nesterenkonia pannonica]|uniref:FmdB family zinc ribbon protein n=1 Tax=Nesterenkonia pannonica TaxID=1548602 RepID=UPI002164B6C3|nr:FmdB family zinc ribbon protein [Nesterenkonia pannonica]
MPTYAYACKECSHAFDIYQSFEDDALTACPECSGCCARSSAMWGRLQGRRFLPQRRPRRSSDSAGASSEKSDSASGSSASSSGSETSSGGSSSSSSASSSAAATAS